MMSLCGHFGVLRQDIVPEGPFWVALSTGLSDPYRLPFVVFVAVASLGGLTLLAYKLRTADTKSTDEREVSSKLERTDLLAGGDPANTLEWVIATANKPISYALLITVLFGLGVLGLSLGRFVAVAGPAVFGGALLSVQAFLRFGWPYFEEFYQRRQPDERDPESLRFQGFSTDVMIFLTLFALTFFGVLLLILVETRLL